MQGLVLTHREFWCPMCRQLANTVLPILPDADGCTDPERLVPNTEPALVRHVADVLRAPCQVTDFHSTTFAVFLFVVFCEIDVSHLITQELS